MKKLLSLILAIAMIFCVIALASCSGEDQTDDTKAPSEQTTTVKTPDQTATPQSGEQTQAPETQDTTKGSDETTAPKDNDGRSKMEGYENIDFGGKEFLFATNIDGNGTVAFNDLVDFWVESYTGDAVNDAVYERNVILNKLYNCTVKAVEGWTEFNADVASGEGKYAGASCAYGIGSTFTNGNFYNVMKLDIDFTKEWWDQAFFRDLTCNGKIFAVCGDFSVRAMRTPWIMYYNKDVYETKFTDIDIYQLVRDHKWTFDKLMEFISKIKNDTDGDQEYKASSSDNADIMGMVTTGHIYRTFYFSSGLRMVENVNGKMTATFPDNTKGPDIVDKLTEVIKTEGFATSGYTVADNCMMSGTTLFVANLLGQLYVYESAENLRLGIVPCPLFEEGDEYATYCDNHACFLGLSTSYANMDQLADFMTVFAYHSHKLVRPAFINQIKYTFASDEDSGEMVDIILNSRTYDAGYFMSFTDGFYGAFQAMIDAGKNQWSQAVARQTKPANEKIASYENRMDSIDDNY